MTTRRAASILYVIYDRPLDAPGGFLVRLYSVSVSAGLAYSVSAGLAVPGKVLGRDLASLEQARDLLPAGLYNLGRTPGDDPKIVEVWI